MMILCGWSIVVLQVLMLLLVNPKSTNAEIKPGFRVRITNRGLNYAREVGVDLLMEELNKLRIPVIQKKVGPIYVTLSNTKVTSFPRPQSAVAIVPGRGLRWTATNLRPNIQGKYAATMKIWKWKVHKSGTITAKGHGLSLVMDFQLGKDSLGRPKMSVISCGSKQGSISLSFRGGWDTSLNLGSKLLRKKIHGIIISEICKEARKEIEKVGMEKLRSIKMSHDVGYGFMLDFSLVNSPVLSPNGYIDFAQKGLMYLKNHMKTPPFPPPIIQEFPNLRQKMAYIFVTNYMVNSALYSAYSTGKLRINVTRDMVPAQYRQLLNTTCDTYLCTGTVFPQLSRLYPGAYVTADVFARKSPLVEFRGNTILFTGISETRAYVNKNDGNRTFIFSIESTVQLSLGITLTNIAFRFNVISIRPNAQVTNSTIGDIGKGFFFTTMLRVGLKQFLIPKLAELNRKGVVIPKVKDITVVNAELIKSTPNMPVLIFGTDIRYKNRPV